MDDLSSAHVYLRLPEGADMDAIPAETLEDCCQLVMARRSLTVQPGMQPDPAGCWSVDQAWLQSEQQRQVRLLMCATLLLRELCMCTQVKQNSIQGCKLNNVSVVYTLWANLRKTASMEVGQVRSTGRRLVARFRLSAVSSFWQAISQSPQPRGLYGLSRLARMLCRTVETLHTITNV